MNCVNPLSKRKDKGLDFWADAPICVKCGVDGDKERNVIVPLRTVHFMAPHPVIEDRGCGVIACGAEFAGVMHSGEPDAVNCPNCRNTEAWKIADKIKNTSADEVVFVEANENGS
jgi:predicted nucleic-acid-binding Zn-ribbon protein